jgi:hypothetical protein
MKLRKEIFAEPSSETRALPATAGPAVSVVVASIEVVLSVPPNFVM